jgi:hypothetical protein
MEKLQLLIKRLENILKDEADQLKDMIPDQDGKDNLIKLVEDMESLIAKPLRDERKYLISSIEGYTQKDLSAKALLAYLVSQVYPNDTLASDLESSIAPFLLDSLKELIPIHMDIIDKDVSFNQEISKPTLDWVESWAPKLSELMELGSHNAIENLITKALEDGLGIEEIVQEIQDLPSFDRKRARATAITEILTANSVAQLEAYRQSPAVSGKRWLHSGSKGITPRPAHVALNETEVEVEGYFNVNGHEALHPRDTNLPPSERINCHCLLTPSVDEKILGLSADEKNKLRQEALKELSKK